MVKICENCKNEVEDDTNFCPNCGFKVSEDNLRICPACKSKNNPESNFCSECGFNLDDDYRETFTTAKKFPMLFRKTVPKIIVTKEKTLKIKAVMF